MSAAVTNDWTIVYAGLTIGGTSDYLLKGPVRLAFENTGDRTGRRAVLDATVVVADPTEATFAAAVQALLVAFSTQRGSLVVTLGVTTLVSLVPGSNTGFNAEASIRDVGGELDTGRSREFEIRVEAELPSNLAAALARVDVEIAYSPARRRTVTFTGAYSALGGSSALAQYEANFDAYAATYLNALPDSPLTDEAPVFNLLPETPSHDAENKVCNFRRIYEEIVFPEKSGALEDPDVVQTRLDVSKIEASEGDALLDDVDQPGSTLPRLASAYVIRPVRLVASYEAWLLVDDLEGKWEGPLFSWVAATLLTYAGGSVAIVRVSPTFDHVQNRITAEVEAVDYGSGLHKLSVEVDDDQDFGVEIDSLLVDDPLAAEVSQTRAVYSRTITRESETIGPRVLFPVGEVPSPPSKGWISLGRKRRSRQERVGLSGTSRTVFVTKTVDVERLRYVSGKGATGRPARQATGAPDPSSAPAGEDPGAGGSSGPTPGAPDASAAPVGSEG